MKKTTIQTIDRYLEEIPETYSRTVISFVSYLNFMRHADSEYPYSDELIAMHHFEKHKKTLSWDAVKNKL